MNWHIPAKTFFVGEYVAITGGPALLLTTTPNFELRLSPEPGLHGIHSESPAGRFWREAGHPDQGLHWYDPYQGRGGMGASSAQFLGAYLADQHLKQRTLNREDLLTSYHAMAWQGEGLRPSGYDVIAQSMGGFAYIHKQANEYQTYAWPFKDLAWILLHTGQKLPTHEHLKKMTLPSSLTALETIVQAAQRAFITADSDAIINAVNTYYEQLVDLQLVSEHTKEAVALLRQQKEVLAVKGCGAMGSDVLLVLSSLEYSTATLLTCSRLGLGPTIIHSES